MINSSKKMLNHYVGVAVVWPAGMGHSCRWSPTPGVARELGARKMKLDLILFICILCIVFVFLYLYLMGHSCSWLPTPRVARKPGALKRKFDFDYSLLFLTVFYSINFIFLYFLICSCSAIHADGPHHQEWPESRGPGKGNCSPFAHFSNTDCGFALYSHKVRLADGFVDYFLTFTWSWPTVEDGIL